MIKLSDYVVKYLEKQGLKTVFMISGGGAMHLNDSFGRSKKIKYICNHNEQASSMSAEGYARTKNQLAAACVTTGPGGLNCLNGLFGAWTDSASVLFISGQVKRATTSASCRQIALRQLGDQEADIIPIVSHITKYAVSVTEPQDIKYHLDKALYLALNGRRGPVWLDIPLDVQAALIDENKLKSFTPPKPQKENLKTAQVLKLLKAAKRPLIVAGHAIRLAGAQKEFYALANKMQIPVVTTFNGFDIVPNDCPFYCGRIGTAGHRAGNFTLQNADVILFLGTRNNIRQVSYNWENFAKNAKKIVVDIDQSELKKPTLKPDIALNCGVKNFISALNKKARKISRPAWLKHSRALRVKYTPVSEFKFKKNGPINPYQFVDALSNMLPANSVTAASNGTASVTLFQATNVKKGQRYFHNSGDASMGYGLPAAIGACLANGGKDVICLEGDGSIMMNIQELQTVKNYNLPIKIFILNNGGYISIIQTQRNFFNGRLTACDAKSGVCLPDFRAVARAFGLRAEQIKTNKNLDGQIKKILAIKGPVVCEVMLEKDYIFAPKLSAKKLPDGTMISPSLEDMYPFLDREEFNQNVLN